MQSIVHEELRLAGAFKIDPSFQVEDVSLIFERLTPDFNSLIQLI